MFSDNNCYTLEGLSDDSLNTWMLMWSVNSLTSQKLVVTEINFVWPEYMIGHFPKIILIPVIPKIKGTVPWPSMHDDAGVSNRFFICPPSSMWSVGLILTGISYNTHWSLSYISLLEVFVCLFCAIWMAFLIEDIHLYISNKTCQLFEVDVLPLHMPEICDSGL